MFGPAVLALTVLGLAVLAALMLLPVRLMVRAGSSPARLVVRLRVMGGLLPWLTVLDSDRPRGAAPAPDDQPEDAPSRRLDRARAGRLLRALPGLLRGLLGPVRIERLWLDARVGLADPADTGALYGALTPLVYGLGPALGAGVRLVPDFSGPVLAGEGEAVLSVVPARWLGPVARFAWAGFGPAPRGGRGTA